MKYSKAATAAEIDRLQDVVGTYEWVTEILREEIEQGADARTLLDLIDSIPRRIRNGGADPLHSL